MEFRAHRDWYSGREGSRLGWKKGLKRPQPAWWKTAVSTYSHSVLLWERITGPQSADADRLRSCRKGMISGRHLFGSGADPEGVGG